MHKSVLSVRFDSNVYHVSTVCGVERKGLLCVCVCVCVCVYVWLCGRVGSLKVSKSKTGMEVDLY